MGLLTKRNNITKINLAPHGRVPHRNEGRIKLHADKAYE